VHRAERAQLPKRRISSKMGRHADLYKQDFGQPKWSTPARRIHLAITRKDVNSSAEARLVRKQLAGWCS
jgi:hypothetical protein